MPQNLTDQNIDETFAGLLHAQGAQLPTANQVDLYDGVGNKSALKVGRANNGATVYAGDGESGFTVLGDVSATGRATLGHMEALSGSTGPNIPKAFVSFWGNTGEMTTSYGVDSVSRQSTGKYIVNLSDETTALLATVVDDHYHIQVSSTINESDFVGGTLKIYNIVASSDSNNQEIYIRCIESNNGVTNFFDPRHIHATILKA
jgi:hypothetical protein